MITYNEINNIWWQQVSNAVRMINNIIEQLIEEKSIALVLPEHTPWYGFFINHIEDSLHTNNSDNSFEILDISDISAENAGKYIAEKYCTSEKLSYYWPGETYAEFLAKSDDIVLNSRYLWIKGINEENYRQWADFVSEYISECDKNKKRASFILECKDEKNSISIRRAGLHTIYWNEIIKPYDYYMFSSLMVSSINCCDEIKHYIAELIYAVSKGDVELCAEIAGYGEKFAENPITILNECTQKSCRSDNSEFIAPDANFTNTAIKETQIKKIFPMIERFRNRFISENYSQIDYFLPMENNNRELISEPYELEIGTLKFISDKKSLGISDKEKDEINFFHMARNKLAHNKILSYDEVKKILNNISE